MEEAAILEQSTQHIKDIKLSIEYKYLMKQGPGGVYLLPEFNNIRRLHGVIFVRRGLYRDGIFRFVMTLPPTYNDWNTHPHIVFTPPVFNPLIDPVTGEFDLTVDDILKEWNPDRHFLQTALTFLKKAFYTTSFDSYETVANQEAKRLCAEDKEEYMKQISAAVDSSQRRAYEPNADPNNTISFSEPNSSHETVLNDLYKQLRNSKEDFGEADSMYSPNNYHGSVAATPMSVLSGVDNGSTVSHLTADSLAASSPMPVAPLDMTAAALGLSPMTPAEDSKIFPPQPGD